jgi:hypothetical protein
MFVNAMVQSITIDQQIKKQSTFFDILSFLCFGGSPALWHLYNESYIGISDYYNFCNLKKSKIDAMINLLNTDNNRAKEMLGIQSKNMSFIIKDLANNTTYYSYNEIIGDDKDIFTAYAIYNERAVIVKIEIGS